MRSRLSFQNLLFVSFLEGVFALAWLLLIPREPKNARLLGFSSSRLILIAIVLAGIVFFGLLVFKAFRDRDWPVRQYTRIRTVLGHKWVLTTANFLAILAAFGGIAALILSLVSTDLYLKGYLLRLMPVIAWSTLLSVKVLVLCWSVDRGFWKGYEARVFILFFCSLAVYLSAARYLVPESYYGTVERPRLADPWIERTETILAGKLLYKDVFTTTPPLTNLLIIPPTLVAKLFDYRNPWTTASYMLYFSFFIFLTAYVLLYMGTTRAEGWRASSAFLLNPLTFGNAVLRRQDEAILTFFFGLFLLLFLKRRAILASIGIGIALLVKLWGALLIPVAFLHTKNWKYLVLPLLVFAVVFSPFLISAGQDAVFWDISRNDTEHPFQFGGVSLGNLWSDLQGQTSETLLTVLSGVFIIGMGLLSLFVAWKRFGMVQDLSILLTGILLLSPKVHAGYFSLIALTLAPLLKSYRLSVPYYLIGILVIAADFFKFPVRNYAFAIGLISIVSILLMVVIFRLSKPGEKV